MKRPFFSTEAATVAESAAVTVAMFEAGLFYDQRRLCQTSRS